MKELMGVLWWVMALLTAMLAAGLIWEAVRINA